MRPNNITEAMHVLGLSPASDLVKLNLFDDIGVSYVRLHCSVCEVWFSFKKYNESFPDLCISTAPSFRGNILWFKGYLLDGEDLREVFDEWCGGDLDTAVLRETFQ